MKFLMICFVGLWALFGTTNFANADYAKGMAALRKGDHAKAVAELEAAAEKGEMLAVLELLKTIRKTKGKPDAKRGYYYWVKVAADDGHPMSAMELSRYFHRAKNKKGTVHYLHRAARAGHRTAQFEIGNILIDGMGGFVNKNIPQGVLFIALSAEQKLPHAMIRMANLFKLGVGVKRDWFASAAYAVHARQLAYRQGDSRLENYAHQIVLETHKHLSKKEKLDLSYRVDKCSGAIWVCAQKNSSRYDREHKKYRLTTAQAVAAYFGEK